MKPLPFKVIAHLLDQPHNSKVVVRGVAIDSRNVQEGDLFFALPGDRADGHTFLQGVALKGGVGAVVKEGYNGPSFGLSLLAVPDVQLALQSFARKSLQKRSSKVVAITGSLGKTITKDFAATLLSPYYHLFASPLSYNSQLTVPLSILMADETEDILILEMAMSEPGQIARLVSIAPPDIALLTTVSLQHVCAFPDGLVAIAREKASIFSHPKTKLGILLRDMPHFDTAYDVGECRKESFSISSSSADYFLQMKEHGVRIQTFDVAVHLPLQVHYQNFLAAVALARALELPWSVIQERAAYIQLPGRLFERVERKGIVFINDAYNANPDSMKAALEGLPKPVRGGKTVAVLGDMNALGQFSEKGHREVVETALSKVDILFCLGKRWQGMKDVSLFENRSQLERELQATVEPGDVVLLKGARQHVLEELLEKF